MKLIKAIRSLSWGYLWLGLFLCGAGALLLAYPAESARAVGFIAGGATFLFGLFHLIRTLSRPERDARFGAAVVLEVLVMITGVVLALTAEQVFYTFASLLALVLVIDGAFKLQTVIRSRRHGVPDYWFLLGVACLTIACGYFCINTTVNAEDTENGLRIVSVLLGTDLIFDGLGNILSLFFVDMIRRKKAKAEKAALAEAEARGHENGYAEAIATDESEQTADE